MTHLSIASNSAAARASEPFRPHRADFVAQGLSLRDTWCRHTTTDASTTTTKQLPGFSLVLSTSPMLHRVDRGDCGEYHQPLQAV
jgi:hypothetical protein